MTAPKFKQLRRSYGFDEVAIVPGETNGSQNLIGALRTAMGVCGASTVKEMQQAEMVIAPAITTEGKAWQLAQH